MRTRTAGRRFPVFFILCFSWYGTAAFAAESGDPLLALIDKSFPAESPLVAEITGFIARRKDIPYPLIELKLKEGLRKRVPDQALLELTLHSLQYLGNWQDYTRGHAPADYRNSIRIQSCIVDLAAADLALSNITPLIDTAVSQELGADSVAGILEAALLAVAYEASESEATSLAKHFLSFPRTRVMISSLEWYFSYAEIRQIPMSHAIRILCSTGEGLSKKRMISALDDSY